MFLTVEGWPYGLAIRTPIRGVGVGVYGLSVKSELRNFTRVKL